MKKEIFALALLLALFALSLWNSHNLDILTGEISELVRQSGSLAEKGDWESAADKAHEAVAMWDEHSSYTHIVLRHSDIDSISDDFYELKSSIFQQEPGVSAGNAEMVIAHLNSISSIEKLRLGSIF